MIGGDNPFFALFSKILKSGEKMKNIVLASTSPRRQELLENVGLVFDIIAPDYDENILNKSFSYELKFMEIIGKWQ